MRTDLILLLKLSSMIIGVLGVAFIVAFAVASYLEDKWGLR